MGLWWIDGGMGDMFALSDASDVVEIWPLWNLFALERVEFQLSTVVPRRMYSDQVGNRVTM